MNLGHNPRSVPSGRSKQHTSNHRWLPAACLAIASTLALGQTPLVESRFAAGDDGWTIVNLGGDYRYLDEISFDGSCLPEAVGAEFLACDPDAGTWMFEAPAKFLGNQLAALDGAIDYRLRWQGAGSVEQSDIFVPHVVIVNTNTATGIAFMAPEDPPINVTTDLRVPLNERAGWLWMDDTTGMEDLSLATREQIRQVLSGVTALRIRGEFITGDDTGFLANVILSGPPRLSIRRNASGQVEITWPAAAADFVLTATAQLGVGEAWSPLDTAGETKWVAAPTNTTRFFRLRKD